MRQRSEAEIKADLSCTKGRDTSVEEWRTISIASDYEISSFGRVRRRLPSRTSSAGKMITPAKSGTMKYLAVCLRVDGNGRMFFVHALVCEAFHGPRPSSRHQTAHYDGNRYNNVPTNLRWATWHENEADKIRHGTANRGIPTPQHGDGHWSRRMPDRVCRGEHSGTSRLSEGDVRQIKATPQFWGVNAALAAQYNISPSHIGQIRRGESWRHIDA